MDFGPPKRPNDYFIAEKYPINFFKILFKGIVMHLVTHEEQRNTPLVVIVSLFDFEHRAQPSIIMIVILNLLGEFDNNF